jgi:hypothetical protein
MTRMYSRRITYLDAPLLKSLGIGGCRTAVTAPARNVNLTIYREPQGGTMQFRQPLVALTT